MRSLNMSLIGWILIPMSLFAHGDNKHTPSNTVEIKKAITVKAIKTQDELAKVYEGINASYTENVKPIFKKKCFDCHGSISKYPWYYKVPRVKQMIDYDVKEAQKHIDMSKDFPFKSHDTPLKDLESINEVSREKSMPPLRYILGHWNATLSKEEQKSIEKWTEESVQKIKRVRYE